eukprot:813188-Pelagomonas_calceolata.AAC.1
MDACPNERLLTQGIPVPENISRAILDWFFPTGTGSSARHQSCPGAIFVRSIPGRPSHIDPTKILPQDMDIHLVGLEFCSDTNPFPTLEAATAQHTNTKTRLTNRTLRSPNRNNKALSILTYTIKPLMGLTRQEAKSLASNLSRHAIQRLTTIINTRCTLHLQGTLGGGGAGRMAVESRRRRVR